MKKIIVCNSKHLMKNGNLIQFEKLFFLYAFFLGFLILLFQTNKLKCLRIYNSWLICNLEK